MVKKNHNWREGAVLEDHTRRKHKILREYVFNYLTVRCRIPHQERFRLAIVDGFAGGGRYKCGAPGSPVIFIEELTHAIDAVNTSRAVQDIRPIEMECLLILNDFDSEAIEELKKNVTTAISQANDIAPRLHVQAVYLNNSFGLAYPEIKERIDNGHYQNVLFNLDQYGDVHVELSTIRDILHSYRSAEIFYTFVIDALLAFLQKSDPSNLGKRLSHLEITPHDIEALDFPLSKNEWLGAMEKIVFDSICPCGPYASPFSINNPGGWRYWLIHFANVPRARQVYNDVLHKNATLQAHFGRSGLNMLSYDPSKEGALYLFDEQDRITAKDQLFDDIPRLVNRFGDAISTGEFYGNIYNTTPAHADDIHAAIIDNPDLEVITPVGGTRQKPHTIGIEDTIKLKKQISFFPMFPRKDESKDVKE